MPSQVCPQFRWPVPSEGLLMELVVVVVMEGKVGKVKEEGEVPGLVISPGTPSWSVLVWPLVCCSPKGMHSEYSRGGDRIQAEDH